MFILGDVLINRYISLVDSICIEKRGWRRWHHYDFAKSLKPEGLKWIECFAETGKNSFITFKTDIIK